MECRNFLKVDPEYCTSLYFHNYNLDPFDDEEICIFAEALKQNIVLRKLNLAESALTPRQVSVLAEALKENKGLRYLNLWMNDISPEGILQVGKMLEINETLEKLTLGDNNMGVGIYDICDGLKKNKTIRKLRITNEMYNGSMSMIEKADVYASLLRENSTITLLDISYNDFFPNAICQLSEGLKVNSSVTTLFLCQRDDAPFNEEELLLNDEAAIALSEALKTNYTLTDLILDIDYSEEHHEFGEVLGDEGKDAFTNIFLEMDVNKHIIFEVKKFLTYKYCSLSLLCSTKSKNEETHVSKRRRRFTRSSDKEETKRHRHFCETIVLCISEFVCWDDLQFTEEKYKDNPGLILSLLADHGKCDEFLRFFSHSANSANGSMRLLSSYGISACESFNRKSSLMFTKLMQSKESASN